MMVLILNEYQEAVLVFSMINCASTFPNVCHLRYKERKPPFVLGTFLSGQSVSYFIDRADDSGATALRRVFSDVPPPILVELFQ